MNLYDEVGNWTEIWVTECMDPYDEVGNCTGMWITRSVWIPMMRWVTGQLNVEIAVIRCVAGCTGM